jgi:hypothetical protein
MMSEIFALKPAQERVLTTANVSESRSNATLVKFARLAKDVSRLRREQHAMTETFVP